jgi:hypothetical protein
VSEGVRLVVEQFQEIVRPDGGSLELLGIEGDTLRIAYRPGTNERCAECVITPDSLRDMLLDVLPEHDASIAKVEVTALAVDR